MGIRDTVASWLRDRGDRGEPHPSASATDTDDRYEQSIKLQQEMAREEHGRSAGWFNVHVKTELGRDDNVVVEAGSELEAERVAAQRHDVAVIIGAYPADDPGDQGPRAIRDAAGDRAEQDYVDAGARLDAAREALVIGTRGQGQEAIDRAGAEYRDAAASWTASRGAVEDKFGPDYGRGTPDGDEADEEPTLHGPYASPEQSDDAWRDALAEHGITLTSEPPREFLDELAEPAATVRAERERHDVAEDGPPPSWMGGPAREAYPDEVVETYRGPYSTEGPVSSYFTDEELADADPNFSYGPAGEPRTRADASSEWVTDPDWDGTDIFAQPDYEPPAEVLEQWEKEDAETSANTGWLPGSDVDGREVSPEQWDQWVKEAQGRAVDSAAVGQRVDDDPPAVADDRGVSRGRDDGERLNDQVDAPADGGRIRRDRSAASESRVTYEDVSRPTDERLDAQVARAHEALAQLAADRDEPASTSYDRGASTSSDNDNDVRER
jgi:hypothetical protein